ncbi:S-layer homology domain-containing protein [Patescibacteria group bacterium]
MKKIISIISAVAIWATFSIPAMAFFPDVSNSHPNFDAIEYVQSEGIVNGYPDGTYQPEGLINRAEFTKIIAEAQYFDDDIAACLGYWGSDFPDVPESEWFAPYVCITAINGVIDGYPDGTFKPTNNINFVEAAKILTLIYDFVPRTTDIWYQGYVEVMNEQGATPTSITSFNQLITRGEMAEMVYRLDNNITNKSASIFNDFSEGTTPSTGGDTTPPPTGDDLVLPDGIKESLVVDAWTKVDESTVVTVDYWESAEAAPDGIPFFAYGTATEMSGGSLTWWAVYYPYGDYWVILDVKSDYEIDAGETISCDMVESFIVPWTIAPTCMDLDTGQVRENTINKY